MTGIECFSLELIPEDQSSLHAWEVWPLATQGHRTFPLYLHWESQMDSGPQHLLERASQGRSPSNELKDISLPSVEQFSSLVPSC